MDLMNLFNFGSQPAEAAQDPKQTLAAVGKQALATGQVTKADAKAVQKSIGKSDVGDYLSNLIKGGKPKDPYDFGMSSPETLVASNDVMTPMPAAQKKSIAAAPQRAPASAPAMPQAALPGSYSPTPPLPKMSKDTSLEKDMEQATQGTASRTRGNVYDKDKLEDVFNMVRGLPEFQAQNKNLDEEENRLKMLQGVKDVPSHSWIKPLLAYADSMNGTNLMAGYTEPSAKMSDQLLKYQQDIGKRRGELAKTILESASKLKTGSEQNDINSKLLQMTGSQNQNLEQVGNAGASSLANSRLAMIPIRAGQDFDKQTMVAARSIESLNRGDKFLTDPSVPLSATTLKQVQQDISNALAGSGAATDHKIAMDMQDTIADILQRAKAKWLGKFDPDKDDLRTQIPEITNQLKKVLDRIRADYTDSIQRQADQIESTYRSSYAAIPNLRETVADKRAELAKRFPKTSDFSATGTTEAPTKTAGKGKYHEMSDAELDAELKRRGGG